MERVNLTNKNTKFSNVIYTTKGKAKLHSFLKENANKTYCAGLISTETGIKKSCCYVYLTRLIIEGKVKRLSRGCYQYQEINSVNLCEKLESTKICFHNLHLLLENPPTPPTSNNSISNSLNEQSNNFLLDLDNRRITVKKNINSKEIILACSEAPLSSEELYLLLGLLDKEHNLNLDGDNWQIVSLDINRDITGIRLDGIECFTLRSLKGVLQRAYNKGDNLRVECSVSKGAITFVELLRFLRGDGTPGVVELNLTVKELQGAIKHLSGQYNKISKYLDYKGVVV